MGDDRQSIERRTLEAVAQDPEGFIVAYRARFGHVLNADNASELFADYAASPETRATRVATVRPAAGRVVALSLARRLAEPVEPGRLPLAVFTSGGNGAGKSTSVPPDGPEHLVFDSTLSLADPSREKIDLVLDAGLHVDVRHLVRDPEEAWQAVLLRAMREGQGRTVTLDGFLATHRGARRTLLELVQHYHGRDRVTFLVWDNGPHGLTRQTVDWLRTRAYPSNDELRPRLRTRLEEARASGLITAAVYAGCAGLSGGA